MDGSKGGQPTKAEWERVRVVAWTSWVWKRVQDKVDESSAGSLPDKDKFRGVLLSFSARWTVRNQKTISMADLGFVFLGSRQVNEENGTGSSDGGKVRIARHEDGRETTRTDFSAYRHGKNTRLNNSVIDAVEEALPGTGGFYKYGPYQIPLWAALSGRINLEDFWQPMMRSKVFDAPQWGASRKLIEGAGLENDTMKVLLKTPWQVWLDTITKLLNVENDATEEVEKVRDHRQYGYAAIGIAAIHLAIQDDPYSYSQEKLKLCRLVEGFASLWEPLDAIFLDVEKPDKNGNIKLNPYPIVGAVKKLTDKLRGIAEASIQCDADPVDDET